MHFQGRPPIRYKSKEDLPDLITIALPEAAQELYRQAYNKVWTEAAAQISDREQLDQTAHRAGWAAVEAEYEHDETRGRWYRKSEEDEEEAGSSDEDDEGLVDKLKNLIS